MHVNAVALLSHIIASAALGYLSWLLAARLQEPKVVRVAAAAVSAALLCSQVALLGLGTSVITFLPRRFNQPSTLLNTFFTIVVLAGALCGVIFLLLSAAVFNQLQVGSDIGLAASFLGLVTVTTLLLLLDGTSIAIRRADFALTRGLIAGMTKVLVLLAAWAGGLLSATMILFAWFASTLAVCLLGYRQLRKVFPNYRYRPRISTGVARAAMRNGLSNHALNLSKFAPSWVIPLIVTETLSPAENAYWYGAWMIAFLVRFIPFATAQAAFAEITNGAASFASGMRKSAWSTAALSIGPTIVLIAFAHPILSLMGQDYAEAGTLPLRLLAFGILPQVAFELYVLAKRVTLELAEPNIVFLINGAASIGAATYGARIHGLVGVATGWLIVDAITALWAGVRLVQLRETWSTYSNA
jgi:O-antigen/teichoic acid export membrane protein